jgi:hypothetical protein
VYIPGRSNRATSQTLESALQDLAAGGDDGTLADLPYHGILDLINASKAH